MNPGFFTCFFSPSRLGRLLLIVLLGAVSPALLAAKTVVFWQPGFPSVDSGPVDHSVLVQALAGSARGALIFAGIQELNVPATFDGADLLVLPYGSAVPTDAMAAIHAYLRAGGNLLVIGGQPLHVPVSCRLMANSYKTLRRTPMHEPSTSTTPIRFRFHPQHILRGSTVTHLIKRR